MSIFKTNKFFRVIKHFILAIPLMFVLGVSLYTIVNPNAKDSYYGETINEVDYSLIENINDLELGSTYQLNTKTFTLKDTTTPQGAYAYSISVTDFEIVDTNLTFSSTDLISFSPYIDSVGGLNLRFYYSDGTSPDLFVFAGSNYVIFNFTFLGSNVRYNFAYNDLFYNVNYHEYTYLSNAFEYGMYQFTQVGFGQIDFVSFFNAIFMTNINNVYASFINNYINYYLFVECVYFAPWVLHAFIHFIYDMADLFRGRFNKTKEDD